MFEKWEKSRKRGVLLAVLLLVIGAALSAVFFFDLFGFAAVLAKGSSVKPDDMRLYGEIFSGVVVAAGAAAIWRKAKEKPEKIFEKSLARYAKTTQQPAATIQRLKKTWETGDRLRDWCRMDDEYIIACINGPAYASVIPLQEVIWAYKTVTRMNGVIKTDTALFVRYKNQKGSSVSMDEKTVDHILQRFMERRQDIVVGHNREVEKLYFKKDMAALKEYALQQRAGGQ